MSDKWKRLEGLIADHKYQLQRCLGSTDHSVVFLAEYRDPEPCKAAVKFISAEVPYAEQQLSDWKNAALISHANLLRILRVGTCRLEDMELLYVASEYAEENLGEILPHRALTSDETREMLNAVVDALVLLHAKNLTHGHIKPSNILATGDQLKLSSDTILPADGMREMRRERSAYDAPEITDSPYTAAADIWSLGVTVVEALTQQPAILPYNEGAEPVIPASVPEPIRGIARNALHRDPKLRWTSAQIAERLNPAAAKVAAAVAAAANAPVASAPPVAAAPEPPAPRVSPLSVPLSQEPAVPLARKPQPPAVHPRVERVAPSGLRKKTVVLPNYVVPLVAAVAVLIAAIALPRILRHRSEAENGMVASSAPVTSASERETPPVSASRSAEPSAKAPEPKKPAAQQNLVQTPEPAAALATAAPTALRHTEPAAAPKTSAASAGGGEALEEVLPDVSPRALATIQGTVRVGVRVQVDAVGNVTEATLDSPGPSKYFADLSVRAARRWVFSSPEAEGRSVPSEWLIYFEFRQSGVHAMTKQVTH